MTWILGSGTSGASCQDHVALWALGNTALALLADGAGSAALGGQGAHIAVTSGQAFLTKALPHLPTFDQEMTEILFMALFTEVRQALLREATQEKVSLHDLATTFMGALVMPHAFASFQVGDGFVVRHAHRDFHLCAPPPPHEYANETSFLTDSHLTPSFHFIEAPTSFFALSSDGLQGVAIDQRKEKPHPGFFEPFRSYMASTPVPQDVDKEITLFLASKPLLRRVKDDRSLALGHWREP